MSAEKVEPNELKRVNSYQWPSGHVGHLTEGQQGALEKFKTLCEQKGYFERGDDNSKKPASHDDETLLRYLRARKFIPQDAFAQFKDTEDWRQENKIDELYAGIDINEYEQARLLYPQWTGRRDKRGIPFYVFEVAHLKAKDVAAYQNDKDRKGGKETLSVTSKVPRKMLTLFALYENLCRFVLPLCAAIPGRPNPETPISQSNNIVDVSNVGLKQFWSLRAHLQDASKLATAHYPETLDRIFIVGAPSFFPTVWEWAKGWFDPITVSKIFILSKAKMQSTLTQFVDPNDLPKKYGGNLDWNFGDMPALDADIANSLRWKEDIRQRDTRTLPIGPIKWQYDADGDLVAVAIGTENGQQRHRVLAGLHPESGVTRLALSPGRAQQAPASMAAAVAAAGSSAPATTSPSTTTTAPTTATDTATDKPPHSNGSAHKMSAPPSNSPTVPGSAPAPPPPSTDNTATATDAFSVPYRDHQNDVHAPPLDARQGTSGSRYEQQAATHAHGQLHHGTPSVQTDGQGVQHTVVEPRTVGQAPKSTELYREDDEPQPGVLEKAQAAAGTVAAQAAQIPAAVMGAVGLGGGKDGDESEKKDADAAGENGTADGRVDGIEPKIVEEYLRAQHMSQPTDQKTE